MTICGEEFNRLKASTTFIMPFESGIALAAGKSYTLRITYKTNDTTTALFTAGWRGTNCLIELGAGVKEII